MVCWTFAQADVNGRVDVETAAKDHGLAFHWFPVQKTFILEKAKDTVRFAIDMPFATYKGKSVELTKAPVIENGHIQIVAADIAKILGTQSAKATETKAPETKAPEKSAQKASTSKNETAGTREVRTIVIDPGHGGKDPGAQGKKANEKDIVLAVAKLLRTELEKEGFNVKLTREKDVFIEFLRRKDHPR